jgi:hypothetical protein
VLAGLRETPQELAGLMKTVMQQNQMQDHKMRSIILAVSFSM